MIFNFCKRCPLTNITRKMLFRRKVPKTKKTNFYKLERQIFEFVIHELNETDTEKLNNQIEFLIRKKRIEYPKSLVSEFYPESMGDITPENLFTRTEEFKLASLKVLSNKVEFYCQCNMVLGQIVDITIKPKPENHNLNNPEITLIEIKMETELYRNLN